MSKRKMVAFVSDRNMCRSLIAEAYLKRHGRDEFEAISFGLQPNRIHYLVHEVLSERGFNLNYYFSKRYEVVERQPFEILVAMHPSLQDKLPQIPYEYHLEVWNFEDPTLKDLPEAEMKKEIEQLADAIEAEVKNFIQKHRAVA